MMNRRRSTPLPAEARGLGRKGRRGRRGRRKKRRKKVSTDGVQHGKSLQPQNGLVLITDDVDEGVAKPTAEEYSPMPGSEEPSESPFEARRPSIGKSENLPRPENP